MHNPSSLELDALFVLLEPTRLLSVPLRVKTAVQGPICKQVVALPVYYVRKVHTVCFQGRRRTRHAPTVVLEVTA